MSLSFFFGEEQTGRFNHVFSANTAPVDFFRVAASGYADFLAVYNQEALFEIVVYSAVELAVHGVILEHVSHVIYGKKVVDSYYFDVVTFGRSAEYEATDTAEAVDTDFCHFVNTLLVVY